MGAHVDTSQVQRLAADLSQAPGRIQRQAPRIMLVGANKVKKGMRADASGHEHLPDLPNHVSYDRIGLLEYEIGFDKVGQGNLANIAAFGSINNAPVFDHTAAARREVGEIARLFGNAGEDAVLGGAE